MTSFDVAKALASARSYGMCEGCGMFGGLDAHHRMTRGSGGVHGGASDVSNDVRNILMLCRPCHDMTLTEVGEANLIGLGWVIERRAGVDPREVPAYIYTVNGKGWWHLTEDGGYRWDDLLNVQEGYRISYEVEASE
jgi:hypothetical protein